MPQNPADYQPLATEGEEPDPSDNDGDEAMDGSNGVSEGDVDNTTAPAVRVLGPPDATPVSDPPTYQAPLVPPRSRSPSAASRLSTPPASSDSMPAGTPPQGSDGSGNAPSAPSPSRDGQREFLLGSKHGGAVSSVDEVRRGGADGTRDGVLQDDYDRSLPTISVYDPERLWDYVERPLMVYMPLRRLPVKPPVVSSPLSIDELPVRCLVHRALAGTELSSRLATNVAERYQAPFAFMYMVCAENQEHYKQTVRPLIREWVDKVEARGGGEDGCGWMLLYVNVAPHGSGSSSASAAAAAAAEAQSKIYWWICADFYNKNPGDRSALVSLYIDSAGTPQQAKGVAMPRPRPSASPRHHPKQWSELLTKIGNVILEVLEARVASYTAELTRIDAERGTLGWDFSDFFIVKESLALMFKKLHLPSEALLKYQELAALILTMGEDGASPATSPRLGDGVAVGRGGAKELLFGLGMPGRPDRPPASVLDYSRMGFRERVKSGQLHSLVLETQLYIFARQCALNLELRRPAEVAKMGGRFMPAYYHELVGQAEHIQDDSGNAKFGDGGGTVSGTTLALSPLEIELFAFKSSWDVVKACDRYFSQAMRPNGLELPAREMHTLRQARVEASRHLTELLEFAQARLLEYARLMGEHMEEQGNTDVKTSLVWELQQRGFLSSQRSWIPAELTGPGNLASRAMGMLRGRRDRGRDDVANKHVGRMRVDGGVVEVETSSEAYFWDSDEEGEIYVPPAEGNTIKVINPIKELTGGDGAPSARHRLHVSRLTDFEDDDSDGTLGSEGSMATTSTGAASVAVSTLSAAASAVVNVGRSSAGTERAAEVSEEVLQGLSRPGVFEDAYLQVSHSLARHSQRAGRVRAAARCWGKRADLLMERGEFGVAQARLSALADLYQAEGWLPQAFWTLHRLARCRRVLSLEDSERSGSDQSKSMPSTGSGSYVSAIMRLVAVLKDPRVRQEGSQDAINRAAAALLRDAYAVASSASVAVTPLDVNSGAAKSAGEEASGSRSAGGATGGNSYRFQCFAEANMKVLVDEDDTAKGQPQPYARRLGPLPAVHVGEVLRVSCSLQSHLPEKVILDSLELEMTSEGRGGHMEGESGSWGPKVSSVKRDAEQHGQIGVSTTDRRASVLSSASSRKLPLRRLESVTASVLKSGTRESNFLAVSPGASSATGFNNSRRMGSAERAPEVPAVFASTRGGATVDIVAATSSHGDHSDAEVSSAGDSSTADGSKGTSPFKVPFIRTTRSQSLSPRASPMPRPSLRASGGGGGTVLVGSGPPHGRSRSPKQRRSPPSPPPSPPSPPLPSASAPGSRLPRARVRPACSARIDGPIELSPGVTEWTFSLRPTEPGIITASRLCARWGGVRLMELCSNNVRGRGRSAGGGVTLPSAWVGMPLPPPSAVVRPFRPRTQLQVIPPAFLPVGGGGWVRVMIASGPDTLRAARLRVTLAYGLSWADHELTHAWVQSESGAAKPEEMVVRALVGQQPTELLVELAEVIESGRKVEVSLRFQTNSTSTTTAGARPGRLSTPKPCAAKVEMSAWHSRLIEGKRGSDGGTPSVTVGPAGPAEGWGVECRTRARANILARPPFDFVTIVKARPRGYVIAEAALTCRSPVPLILVSCEICDPTEGVEVTADPNAFLTNEILSPGQPLRLTTCFRRRTKVMETVRADVGRYQEASEDRIASLRVTYRVGDRHCNKDSDDATVMPMPSMIGNRSHEDEEHFVFDIPLCESLHDNDVSKSSPYFGVTAVVEPCEDNHGLGHDDELTGKGMIPPTPSDPLQLTLGKPRAFDFSVDAGMDTGSAEAAGRIAFQVVASPEDWMISGLIRGSTKLKEGKQTLCRVHLVPIRGGMLGLPRLDVAGVSTGGDESNRSDIVVWSEVQRKVLVLPLGDTTSICKARPGST